MWRQILVAVFAVRTQFQGHLKALSKMNQFAPAIRNALKIGKTAKCPLTFFGLGNSVFLAPRYAAAEPRNAGLFVAI